MGDVPLRPTPEGDSSYMDMKPDDWASTLLDAVKESNSTTIASLLIARQKIIKSSPRPDFDESYGDKGLIKALFAAIDDDRLEVATQLIRARGVKLSRQEDPLRRTALHQAVVKDRDDIVKELLDHTECIRYIDLGDYRGRAALHEAAARGNDHIVQILLDYGANINVPDNRDMTPLHLVIWRRKDELVKEETERTAQSRLLKMAKNLIQKYGARVNTKDQFGKRSRL